MSCFLGELAELVIYQGPIYDDRMYLGSTGFWNSTMCPRVFYMSHITNNFDLTRAEIIAGVDGLMHFYHKYISISGQYIKIYCFLQVS